MKDKYLAFTTPCKPTENGTSSADELYKTGHGTLAATKEIKEGLREGEEISEAFITAAEDFPENITRKEAATRVSLYLDKEATQLHPLNDHVILEFDLDTDFINADKIGIQTPIEVHPSRGQGFVPGGRTGGGAREWIIDGRSFMAEKNIVIKNPSIREFAP